MKDSHKTFILGITDKQRDILFPHIQAIKPGESLIAQVYMDGIRIKKLTAEQSKAVSVALMG